MCACVGVCVGVDRGWAGEEEAFCFVDRVS